MLETALSARRTSVLGPGPTSAGIRVEALPSALRFVLRIYGGESAALGSAGGFDLSGGINSVRATGGHLACRLGPDEWLLIAPDADAGRLLLALEADLAGRTYALVEVSHRNVALEVAGPHAREVLNAGIPLDLADGAFPAGSATRTLLGKAEVVLVRPSEALAYRVECWRSFGPYVQGFLNDAAREFT